MKRDQEDLRSHYDRLYGMNVTAITELRLDMHKVLELLEGQRPFPRLINIREADTPTEVPVMSWHQQLARRQVPMHKAGLFSAVVVLIVEILRAIADGTIRLH